VQYPPGEVLSVVALDYVDRIRQRARSVLEADRALLSEFLGVHKTVSTPCTEFGTTAVLRLMKGDVEPFLARLRTEQETAAVPGRFFELENHFRIGMGVDTEMFREGLKRIGKVLDYRPAIK
jgi:aspartate/methionine/tyrosine aminotransferase